MIATIYRQQLLSKYHNDFKEFTINYLTTKIEGATFEYDLRRNEGPNLVFLSGDHCPIEAWEKVVEEIGELGTVLTYNRSGIGKSSKATTVQDGQQVISTLRKLIKKLDLNGPIILIAHSSGGLFANLFARLFPNEIDAVALVESAHPDQMIRFEGHFALLARIAMWLAKKDKYSEFASFKETRKLINEAQSFPNIPLAVITGIKKSVLVKKSFFEIHKSNQQDLAKLTPTAQHIIAKNSGHIPMMTEPKIISDTIKDIIACVMSAR